MQTELHRHLDVSLRLSTLLELCQARGLEGQSTSLSVFKAKVVLSQPLSDLNSVLAHFVLIQKVLDRPEVLERVAFETLEDCFNEGTRKVELRFSPGFVGELSNLSWDFILDSFEKGLKRGLKTYPNIKAGLICIATRDQGLAQVERTIDFFLKNQKRMIGFDLAGNEVGFPCRDFENSFKRIRASGAKITIHAGEAAGPENIWEALTLLGAHRIGHGINCIRDPKLMTYLRDHEICLEMCPTSNWLTKSVINLAKHPLKQVLTFGIPVCINTDDPTVFGVDLPHEIRVCREKIGLSDHEIEMTFLHAAKASFLS